MFLVYSRSMNPAQDNLESALLQLGFVDQGKIDKVRLEVARSGKSFKDVAVSLGLVTTEQVAKAESLLWGIPYFEGTSVGVSPELLSLIPESVAERFSLFPLEVDRKKGELSVVMTNPGDVSAIQFLSGRTGFTVKPYIAEAVKVENLIKDSYSQGLVEDITETLRTGTDVKARAGVVESMPESIVLGQSKSVQIVEKILEYAVKSRASDIHIEPGEVKTRIRYRIDGILQEKLDLSRDLHPGVVSRVKILAGMKIDERRLPQDGRFNYKVDGLEVDLRISSLPTVFGEKIVMRLLDKTAKVPSLADLGLRGKALKTLEESVLVPHGIILITGPTGSGKTTTLYALLTKINTSKVNIVTLEDPVEYQMPGVNQVQVNPQAGLTFASGLRSFLRQDPNIIMVGEIRDEETADLAIQASLTGHLVFSTVHTNSAAGALPRLLDMKAEPFLLASSITAIVGQRVVRKVCQLCKETYVPEAAVTADIKTSLGNLYEAWRQGHPEAAEMAKKMGGEMVLSRGKGCSECGNSGYHGRIGIFEVLLVDEKIARLIMERADAGAVDKTAQGNGMILMKQDGYLKILEGVTTIEEVLRVAQV